MITKDTKNYDEGDVPTSMITFIETEHGRLRRKQRGIDKKDLQAARKYGIKRGTRPRLNGDRTSIYTYKDIVYIVNDVTGEEVTSYAVPLKLDPVPIDHRMQNEINKAKVKVADDLDCWTSNTVLVVDTSGSMRKADVWGTRTRLKAVWVSIALDFIAPRLESGSGRPTDIISIVSLGSPSTVLIREAPCSWELYNQIVALYNDDAQLARGHGPFISSLEEAKKLLTRNTNASCAMALVFLSDGKPSDAVQMSWTLNEMSQHIAAKVGHLARQFGRRLTFTAIGIGDEDQFETLEDMVDEAKDYGAIAEFRLPSMTSSALGEVFTSVATSITTTQTEMTNLDTGRQQRVRTVNRESKRKASELIKKVSYDDFWIYHKSQISRSVYTEWFEGRQLKKSFVKVGLQDPRAEYVALAKGPFGEGAERFAYRFFELASDAKTILGFPMVAKESRLILEDDLGDERARKKFVQTFCSTQQLARRLAEEFNEKMDETRRIDRKTPRISFLDCSIYQLDDTKLGKLSVLVEQKLDHTRWRKWNSNNGFVDGMRHIPRQVVEKNLFCAATGTDLTLIEEGSEDEEEDVDEEKETSAFDEIPVHFTASEVAQAFSHFTYLATGRKRLVCDLQGVFDENAHILQFSDPVIHYYNAYRTDRRNVHGRTDRGIKGVQSFFETHKDYHGYLCRLMTRGFKRPRHLQGNRKSSSHQAGQTH